MCKNLSIHRMLVDHGYDCNPGIFTACAPIGPPKCHISYLKSVNVHNMGETTTYVETVGFPIENSYASRALKGGL